MNTRGYLNYFPAIKHLDVDKQSTLLEQARYEAFVVQKRNVRSVMLRLALLVLLFAISMAVNAIYTLPVWLSASLPPLLIPVFLITDRYLQAPLLKKGLEAYLTKHPEALD